MTPEEIKAVNSVFCERRSDNKPPICPYCGYVETGIDLEDYEWDTEYLGESFVCFECNSEYDVLYEIIVKDEEDSEILFWIYTTTPKKPSKEILLSKEKEINFKLLDKSNKQLKLFDDV